MNTGRDQLVVRQHERYACRVEAMVRVDAECAERVALSRHTGDGRGGVAAVMVDCSSGGLGLECGVFVPRGTRLAVRVHDAAKGIEGFEAILRVQRVTMIGRKPLYYLGTSFVRDDAVGAVGTASIAALLAGVKKIATPPAAPAANAGGAGC